MVQSRIVSLLTLSTFPLPLPLPAAFAVVLGLACGMTGNHSAHAANIAGKIHPKHPSKHTSEQQCKTRVTAAIPGLSPSQRDQSLLCETTDRVNEPAACIRFVHDRFARLDRPSLSIACSFQNQSQNTLDTLACMEHALSVRYPGLTQKDAAHACFSLPAKSTASITGAGQCIQRAKISSLNIQASEAALACSGNRGLTESQTTGPIACMEDLRSFVLPAISLSDAALVCSGAESADAPGKCIKKILSVTAWVGIHHAATACSGISATQVDRPASCIQKLKLRIRDLTAEQLAVACTAHARVVHTRYLATAQDPSDLWDLHALAHSQFMNIALPSDTPPVRTQSASAD